MSHGLQRQAARLPAIALVWIAAGATMRQSCNAAGIDPNAPLMGIPATAF